jgi:dihydroorotate dehydrogenase (NAD+) catalytic subunit
MSVDLRTEVGGLRLRSPILLASGTAGYGEEILRLMDVRRLGGLVTKGISPEPWPGNPPPRIVETPAGMINAIGLQNMGLRAFLETGIGPLEELRRAGVAVVVNVIGKTVEGYVEVCRALDAVDAVDALELNVSCPNVKEGGISFGTNPEGAAQVTRASRRVTDKPLWVKLSPNVTDIAGMARAVVEAGADAVTAINTLLAMEVDVERRRPVLANVHGGLSGPAIRPVALHRVKECAAAVEVPVVGIGGICDARDVLAFLMVGARAVQVGTATYRRPEVGVDIVAQLEQWMEAHGEDRVSDLVGVAMKEQR